MGLSMGPDIVLLQCTPGVQGQGVGGDLHVTGQREGGNMQVPKGHPGPAQPKAYPLPATGAALSLPKAVSRGASSAQNLICMRHGDEGALA